MMKYGYHSLKHLVELISMFTYLWMYVLHNTNVVITNILFSFYHNLLLFIFCKQLIKKISLLYIKLIPSLSWNYDPIIFLPNVYQGRVFTSVCITLHLQWSFDLSDLGVMDTAHNWPNSPLICVIYVITALLKWYKLMQMTIKMSFHCS